MEENSGEPIIDQLPIKSGLDIPKRLTQVVLLLMALVSIFSLFFPASIYTTQEQQKTYLVNDMVNLILGLPLFILFFRLLSQKKLISLILWPGILFFVLYNYLAYMIGMPLSWYSGIFGLIVILCFSAAISLFTRIDFSSFVDKLAGVGPRVIAAVVVLIFGIGFLIQAFLEIYGYLTGSGNLTPEGLGVFIADIVGSVIWLISGVFLITRKPFGYLLGWSGLFAVVVLNIGLLFYLILQPLVQDTAFEPIDFLIILIFTLVCFAPFGFFLRELEK